MNYYSSMIIIINLRENTNINPNSHLLLDRIVKQYSIKYTPKGSAICVQRFDDSQSSAIRITYRNSLRSSSFQEPRYPS